MMIINKIKEKDCICITPYSFKKRILEKLALDNFFYSVHFYTKEELQNLLLYEYHPQALWKYANHFATTLENGKKELEVLYTIDQDTSFPILYQKKCWLEENHLLIEHPAFLHYIKGKKALIYGYDSYEMKFLEKHLRKFCNVEYVEEETLECFPDITEYETLEQEVVGTAEKITKLLSQGVSIHHIKIGTLHSDYQSIVSKIFRDFHLPFEKIENHTLIEYAMVQKFLSMIDWKKPVSEISSILEQLEQIYPKENVFYTKIYNWIITIINRYYQQNLIFSDIKDILFYEFRHQKVSSEHYQNVIQEVDFLNTLFTEEDHIFLMGVNLGELPQIYEDQDYLSDQEKKIVSLPTSFEMTIGEEKKTVRRIRSLSQVHLSFKRKSPFKEYLPSTFIEEWKEKGMVQYKKGDYSYSNHYYNEYLLNASLDGFINYHEINEHLEKLYGLEPISYRSYCNQFDGISHELFIKKVPNCMLSYTAMQKFFECPFKYYVHSILKIDPPFIETPSLIVGNLFHSILEQYFKRHEDLELIIARETEKIVIVPEGKRNFYIKKYQNEIRRLIQLIEKQQSLSSFQANYFEETIAWDEKESITFRIFGKIDKIMTFDDGKNSYVIVIDYKTGNATSDLSKVIYGMNMQLLMYLYLISKDSRFQQYRLGGAYIESISASIPNYQEGKTIEELLWEQSKLDGISLKRDSFMEALDHQYRSASYIKGIRVKKDGTFYNSSRLLEDFTLEKLLDIVKQNIDVVKDSILKADFKIAPKKFSNEIGSSVSSCTYCPYRDICYRNPKDIMTLKEYKNLEFLEGGEENDTTKAAGCIMD